MIKIGLTDTNLIRFLAEFLIRQSKSQYRLYPEIGFVCKFNTTDSPYAKTITDFLGQKCCDVHAGGKSVRDSNVIKKNDKRALNAFGLDGSRSQEVIFLSGVPHNFCDR